MFTFGNVTKVSTKYESIESSLLIDSYKPYSKMPYLLFVLESNPPKDHLNVFRNFIERLGILNYRIVNCLGVNLSRKDIKGSIIKFYKNNPSDWTKYIPGSKAIISLGAALYNINRSDQVMVHFCYENVFQKSYFWNPRLNSWIFPIDSLDQLISNTSNYPKITRTYKGIFAEYQIKKAYITDLEPMVQPQINIEVVKDKNKLLDLWKEAENTGLLSWDLETSGFDHLNDKIICFAFCYNKENAYVVEWKDIENWGVKENLNNLFKKVKNLGANLKFDCLFLRRHKLNNATVDEDIVQLGHVINENRYNSLKTLSYFYTPFGGYEYDLDAYKEEFNIKDYSLIPPHILYPYAAKDVLVTLYVWEELQKELDRLAKIIKNEKIPGNTLRTYYEKIMMPMVKVAVDMEERGIYINKKFLDESRLLLLKEKESIIKHLSKLWNVPEDFNFNSPAKLGALLKSLGWEKIYESATGGYATSDECIERWIKLGRAGASELKRLRSLDTILKTFISYSEDSSKGWARYIKYHPEDGSYRIHPVFNVMRTDTGRCRTDSPNVQNIPARGEFADYVKNVITTPPDTENWEIISADFSSLQMRLAAIDTNLNKEGKDENLYKIYNDPKLGGDPHSMTAHSVFCSNQMFTLDVIKIELENGEIKKFYPDEKVKLKDGSVVLAKDLTEGMEIAD